VKEKQLFILSFDLIDAFESISREVIKINMTSVGVPEKVLNSFKDASIQIHTRKGFLKNYIEKGVQTGCFLSSTLFNIGMDPFIRNIRENIKNVCINTMKIIQRFK
jgi:hypothetical protein